MVGRNVCVLYFVLTVLMCYSINETFITKMYGTMNIKYKTVLYFWYCLLLATGDELFYRVVVVEQRFKQVRKHPRNTTLLANSFLHSSQINS